MEARAGGLDGAPQVVLGLGMRTRKAWTALLQHIRGLRRADALLQEKPGDPVIRDAPVRLGKSVQQAERIQTPLI